MSLPDHHARCWCPLLHQAALAVASATAAAARDHAQSAWRVGGGERNRTDDLLLAKQALSQLSYTPKVLGGLAAQNPWRRQRLLWQPREPHPRRTKHQATYSMPRSAPEFFSAPSRSRGCYATAAAARDFGIRRNAFCTSRSRRNLRCACRGRDKCALRICAWWAREDLNLRPHAYQARALTN